VASGALFRTRTGEGGRAGFLADSLTRNGYFLIANSAATGALGIVYWLLMARLYPTADVGRATALYAAMNLIAALTALNFNGLLIRFIPQAGRLTGRFIVRAYSVSAAASVGFSVLFLVTAGWWGRSYSVLRHPVVGVVFAVSVVAWAVFTLQDSVLVGLRSAYWVLVENSSFGVVKIGLLVVLVAALPDHLGIYVSWMLPVFVAVPIVNALIFGRLVPMHRQRSGGGHALNMRQIKRFVAGDYPGALFLLASAGLVPVIVAARVGARQEAYFYMAWIIASMVDMIAINMGMSLTVEGATDPAALADNVRRALRRMASLLVPCAAAVALLAPFGLRLFGPGYAGHGAEVLELLAVATLPRAAIEVYLGALRAQSRTTVVAVVQGVRAVLMLGLTFMLTGTIGAAVAVLTSQVVVAALVGYGLWSVVTGDRSREMPLTGGVRA
jgi:O-antigen/teichoic acid export membrane protein